MNYYRLSNDITDVVIEALQHFEHIDKHGPPQSFDDATKSISGGIERYRSDPIFRVKVQMLVSRITAAVQKNERPNVELTGSRAALLPVSPATEGSEVERRVGGADS